eukprot:gene32035-biopygen27313
MLKEEGVEVSDNNGSVEKNGTIVPPGWVRFYWINPIAAYKAILVNEYMSPDCDCQVGADTDCISMERFGGRVHQTTRDIPTDMRWVLYSASITVALILIYLVLTMVTLMYLRVEAVPPPPVIVDISEVLEEEAKADKVQSKIPYEPVAFAFKDVTNTVTLPTGEDLPLLQGVSGYFEPGTVTALTGFSGTGKTTLLDVLAGRKNAGIVKGGIFVNGKPVEKHSFRQMMGYVEQFDSLAPNDTAREAI